MRVHPGRAVPFVIVACMAILALTPSFAITARAEDGTIVRDEWAVLFMVESEMGFLHSQARRIAIDDVPHLKTTSKTEMQMKRGGASIEMSMSSESVESVDGVLVSVRASTLMSQQETLTEARVEGNTLFVKQTVYGATSEREVPWEKDVLGENGMLAVVRSHLARPGATFSYKTYMPDFGARVIHVNGRVVGPVEKDVQGTKHEAVEVHETNDAMPGLVTKTWYTPEGKRLMTTVPIVGGISTIYVSKERAQASEPGEMDALIGLAAQCSIRLPYPYSTQAASYRVHVKEGDTEELAKNLASDRQKVLGVEDGVITFRTDTVVGDPARSYPIPFEGSEEFREYLVGNSWLQSDDPEMEAAARAAIGDEVDALAAAKKLERWVYDIIRDKNMSVGFASAKEVLDTPSGDCSEHAVLLAAALRAVGIPARVSMGLLYWNQKYAGHAWTEAWIGEWVPLDGTMARPFVSAAHIDLGQSSLNDEGIEELFIGLTGTIGNFDQVEVLEFQHEGATIRVDEEFRPYTVTTHYENALFGFRIGQPKGWKFDSLDETGFGAVLLEIRDQNGSGRIGLQTMALPYNSDFSNIVSSMVQGQEVDKRKTWRVGGRDGELIHLRGEDGDSQLMYVVSDDELLFVFYCRNPSDGDATVFESTIATLEWLE